MQRIALRKLLDPLEKIVMCCNSCEHYSGKRCSQYAAQVPENFTSTDINCDAWQHDSIPF